MLFNSLEFIFLFLPLTLLGFFGLSAAGGQLAIAWLLAASIFFYSWWNPANLYLFIPSIVFNYLIGMGLAQSEPRSTYKKALFIFGIGVNLALIGYFKYAGFLASTANTILGTEIDFEKIILPLGISFFTFQQIAYLVDVYRGETKEKYDFLRYSLFVSYFPHLIAGPIVQHKELIPQLANPAVYRFKAENFAIGITTFALGLFKKVVLADGIAVYATQTFDTAATGVSLTFVEAWVGALAFTLQLYFDFSGYSDMAIGLARMMGFHLPINFNSPYKATNIIDFWRRWHITLSNFLRDYLYIPLGGNRRGEGRRNLNLMMTMLLGGLWHGAGWTFVLWGGLHGLYLLINNQWRSFRQRVLGHDLQQHSPWSQRLSWLLTFLAVVVGWVIFRAENMTVAWAMLKGMAGGNGLALPEFLEKPLAFLEPLGVEFGELMPNLAVEIEQVEDVYEVHPSLSIISIAFLMAIVWLLPNTQQWMALSNSNSNEKDPVTQPDSVPSRWKKLQWQPNQFWAIVSAILTAIALLNLTRVSEFLYFEF